MKATRQFDWINISVIGAVHVLGAAGVVWAWFNFSWPSTILALVWFAFCGVSITGGYHRMYSHPTYKANRALQLFYLLFGAASVQNSALKWSSDHRLHHGKVDQDEDPYNIRRGFWWAHIGWVMVKSPEGDFRNVPDLRADKLVQWQHRYYVPLAIVFGFLLPGALGLIWGDPIGALFLAGFLRLAFQYHATFAVNSFAHYIGSQPYTTRNSARDSWVTALITLGEGYHNFHHRFQIDYRNGVRSHQFDPTKWFVWTMSKVGVTWDLKRVSDERIASARQSAETEAASTGG